MSEDIQKEETAQKQCRAMMSAKIFSVLRRMPRHNGVGLFGFPLCVRVVGPAGDPHLLASTCSAVQYSYVVLAPSPSPV